MVGLVLRDENLVSFRSSEGLDLEEMVNIEFVNLSHNRLESIIAIRTLTTLKSININNNQIASIDPLEPLELLEEAFFCNNQVSDITALKRKKHLEKISLFGNKVYHHDNFLLCLKTLPNLKELSYEANPIASKIELKHRIVLETTVRVLEDE